ncbi:N-acetylglucosamine-6-phosphate deacetylase [Rhizobium sp. KVB221]|uniref:N-acetylglucosamine-6-phosphate deacetylase n=1 Tax=Rhizobium setariae TaxID=2801340 RepID=A0A937CPX5_9HYPH|nr:N-acetylglucosamine-6-phosphate deacetylase [Rhizobium setariae]MBL0372322.1 N-acetylglucosamine-6-phosphate deacetylase [Rhizobium setariae]
MSDLTALTNADIFDGAEWHRATSLVIENGKIKTVGADVPAGARVIDVQGALVVPGFIDLQVNGGGGVMLNDEQTVEGLAQICAAHAKFGTTALLPTLITDTREITAAAIAAGKDAKAKKVPGFLGLHLEGPHLSIARKGAHDPQLIRPMEQVDLERLLALKGEFDGLMITVAPENTTEDQVRQLAQAGFTVSLGHTNTAYETAEAYVKAGARTATHLFNAMSPLENRTPGLVGTVLNVGSLYAGIIADGFHVHPASMSIALRAKQGSGKIFIVSDAMSTIGTDLTGFMLNGRQIYRKDGRLTLADGTLAGADIDMLSSVRFVHEKIGLPFEEALRMASLYPAEAIGVADRKGLLKPGFDADFVVLGRDHAMKSTWIGGDQVFSA